MPFCWTHAAERALRHASFVFPHKRPLVPSTFLALAKALLCGVDGAW